MAFTAIGLLTARQGVLGRIATNAAEQWAQTLSFVVQNPSVVPESPFASEIMEARFEEAVERGLVIHYRIYLLDGTVAFSSDEAGYNEILSEDDLSIIQESGNFSRDNVIGPNGQRSPGIGEAFAVITFDGVRVGYANVCVDRTGTAPPLGNSLQRIFFGFATVVILLTASALWLIRQYLFRQGRLEKDLREVVDDLSRAEMQANMGHWSSDIKTNKVHWSAGMFAVYGCDPETFVPTKANVLSCIVPAERHKFQSAINHLRENGGETSIETRLIRPDGTPRYVFVKAIAEKGSSGGPARLSGFTQDITDSKTAELALLRNQELLDRAIEAADAAIWDWDVIADELYSSPRFAEILGEKGSSWKLTMAKHNRLCHPEDLARVRDAYQKHAEDRATYDIEYRLKRADGEYVWIHSRGRLVKDVDGIFSRMVGTVTDITERRREQEDSRRNAETLALAMEASRAGYFDRRWDQENIYWSPRLREILGLTDLEFSPLADTFNDFVHPDDLVKLKEAVGNFRSGGPSLDTECRLRHVDGHFVWVQLRGMIQRDASGQPQRTVGFVVDISERKGLELELEARKQMYEDVATAAGEYIWEFDRSGAFTFVSDGVEEVLGCTAAEMIGRKPAEFMSAEQARLGRLMFARLIKTKQNFKGLEVPGHHSNGLVVWQQLSGKAIINEEGKLTGYRGVARDITAQKQAEQAVTQSERKFRDLIEGSIQGLVVHRRYEPLFINDAYAKMVGYPDGTAMLNDIDSILDILPAEFKTIADSFWERSMSGQLDGQVFRGKVNDRYGNTVWTDAIGRVVDWDGEPAFQLTVLDVTEQRNAEQAIKDSEERFRVVAENANDLITIRGASGGLTYVSPSSVAITGYLPEELIESPPGSMTFEDDLPHLEQRRIERAANPEAEFGSLLWRMRRKDGHIIWLETLTSTLPLREHETVHRVLSTSRDVTDRVEYEREIETARDRLSQQADELSELAIRLEQEREKAEAANVAKSQFLAMMSHELRTPMTGVLGMVDLLNRTKVTESQGDMLNTLHRSATALLELLNDILDFSKIEAGEFDLESVDFRMSILMDDVRDLFAPVLSAKGLSLAIDIQEGGEDVLCGDPTRLRQVLLNLIGNANKFTETGGVTIKVSQDQVESGDLLLRFDVVDTGIGIAPADQQRLFQAFVQAESNTTRKFGGTGLGLAICKQIVEAMGGAIWVDSEVGRGSTFTFTCPLALGDRARADLIVAESSTPDIGHLSPMRILIAEDNPTTQMLVQTMLERDGHMVVTADNGAEAVKAATAEDFDIVLMDMQMPVMDGPEAMQAIRKLTGPIATRPIIALTADAIRSHRQKYIDAGANVIVTKPIKWPVLFGEMNRLHGQEPKTSNGQTIPINGEHEVDDMDNNEYEQVNLLDSDMLDALLEVLDEETLAPMLIAFKENMSKYAGELDRLVEQRDLEQSRRTAHALKGLSAQFGASRVSSMAKSIEDEITDIDDVGSLLPLLHRSIEETITALDERA